MTTIDLLPAAESRGDGSHIGLLHLVGLVDWEPPERDSATLATLRPGRWVATEVGRSLLRDCS